MASIWKNEINRLNSAELTFELESRGLSAGTVVEMRKSLGNIFKLESSGMFKAVECAIPFEDNLQTIKEYTVELNSFFEEFTGDISCSNFKRVSAIMCHTLRRVEACKAVDNEQRKKLNEALLSLHNIKGEYEAKVKRFRKRDSSECAIDLSCLNINDEEENDSATSEEDEHEFRSIRESLHSSTKMTPVRSYKTVPVSKWNLKFSGSGQMSLSAFLEHVEELRVARGVSKEELYISAIDLFTDKALLWYRANRKKAVDWNGLVKLLKDEFHSVDYDERLFDEIKVRTQGPTESIGMYLAVMDTMFGRLSARISEQQQLKIILRNITPFYQNQLGLIDVKSKQELLDLGRRLEARKLYMDSYVPPARRKTALEPDLAYLEAPASHSLALTESTTQNITVKCYRCGQSGHKAFACQNKAYNKYCYRCKKEGFTVRTCPNCSLSDRVSKTFRNSTGNGATRQ